MITPTVLVVTWRDGLSVVTGETRHQEFAGEPVKALTPDGRGGALAIVNGHSLCRRTSDGGWSTIATSEFELACSVAVGDVIYIGTDEARVLRKAVNDSGKSYSVSSYRPCPTYLSFPLVASSSQMASGN